jgi:hypothetical protein
MVVIQRRSRWSSDFGRAPGEPAVERPGRGTRNYLPALNRPTGQRGRAKLILR